MGEIACLNNSQAAVEDEALAQEVDALWQRYPDPTGRTLNILNDLQDAHRYLPEASLLRLSELTETPIAHLKQMGEYFDYLSLDPVGRVLISVCDGTACHTQNAPTLLASLEKTFGISAGETTPDGNITLRSVGCVGACGIAPVILVEGEAYGHMALSRISEVSDRAISLANELEREALNGDKDEGGSIGSTAEGQGQ